MIKRIIGLVVCLTLIGELYAQNLVYHVNLNDRADDQFKVTLTIEGKTLSKQNAIFQFASTAPGTYQVMNMGRYVRSFKAFNKKGKELSTKQLNTNQWEINKIEKVRKIQYNIAETWDTQVSEYPIYLMCGSSLEKDHALINGQTVFGFFKGMQGAPLKIKLDYPQTWKVGTALNKDSNGYFKANSFDHIVDSPILLGRLTKASTMLGKVPVEIYTYSKTDKITSEKLLKGMSDMLKAAQQFLKELPVDRYTFLYHFENRSAGAWEHSYSSEYVYREQDWTPAFAQQMSDVASHEFFHVVTPLNIHSEIIEKFNFEKPTPSEHLWLYEGTTEWASHIMQLRYGLINLDDYFKVLHRKVLVDNKYYDANYSLSKLSMTSFTKKGQRQYGNVYMRGALVAGLLDIRLLELSGGKRGLREVVLELAKKYGKKRAFSEETFFDDFVKMTYPEIKGFFEKYIKNATPLPYKAYYNKIGINYYDTKDLGLKAGLKYRVSGRGGKLTIVRTQDDTQDQLKVGDEVIALNGKALDANTGLKAFGKLLKQPSGTAYLLKVKRNGKVLPVDLKTFAIKDIKNYYFEVNPKASDAQKKLRERWLKNF
ncbi:peptidase [uncultured Microscilla sp.]|uniref:M61 family metallopeptidase n=1 Tax=uncultured Microscilla sp. TaxID=432653 RepID=UPI002639A19A|nr:peptidase [uncultured Microscilla sp.]